MRVSCKLNGRKHGIVGFNIIKHGECTRRGYHQSIIDSLAIMGLPIFDSFETKPKSQYFSNPSGTTQAVGSVFALHHSGFKLTVNSGHSR